MLNHRVTLRSNIANKLVLFQDVIQVALTASKRVRVFRFERLDELIGILLIVEEMH